MELGQPFIWVKGLRSSTGF